MLKRFLASVETACHVVLIALCILTAAAVILALAAAAMTYHRTEELIKWI